MEPFNSLRKCWNQVFSDFSSNFFALKTWRKCWNQVFSNFSSNFFDENVGKKVVHDVLDSASEFSR